MTNAYDTCRCERALVCATCLNPPEDCDCSNLTEDLEDEFDPDDPSTDDPLVRTLLGLPSGIHCHDENDRCLSRHCTQKEDNDDT